MTAVRLGDLLPNFDAKTTHGNINFHQWLGNSWGILFSHPADFTPVCTTELARAATYANKFLERNVKLIALSCDNTETHIGWIKDIQFYSPELLNKEFPFPLIDDESRDLATQLGMLDPDEKDSKGLPMTCRTVFFIGPDKRLKASIIYPPSTGRNFDEILRVVDSLQLTIKRKVATPVDWKPGCACMVLPTLSAEDAEREFPEGINRVELPSRKDYLRTVTLDEIIKE